jgi:O-acetyl-ADP-ribose deacetylase (regulator of RNase III)
MRIEVRRGDIADQPELDAVVNAANTELWMGSGVAGALKRRGGDAVEREAVAQGPIALGDAVRTSAGGLPNRHVIHAAAMGYRAEDDAVPKRAGSRSSADIIRKATLRSLALADEAGDRSIGLPALATGVAAFPIDECAEAMIAAARDYGRDHAGTKLELVAFVVRGEDDRAVFASALERRGS